MTLLRRLCFALWCAAGLAPAAHAQTLQNIVPAPLQEPTALAFDGSGNLYVLNQGLLSVPVLFFSGPNSVVRIAPDGTQTVLTAPDAALTGLAVTAGGTVYVSNVNDAGIDRVEPDGSLSPFVGPAQGLSTGGALAVDAAGNLYVGNEATGGISKVTPAGTVTPYLQPQGSAPISLAVDAGGTLYIGGFLPGGGLGVMKVTASGTLQTFVDLTEQPSALGFDPQGNLYVCACSANAEIDEYSPAGNLIASFGMDDSPIGLALDAAGNSYFTAAPTSLAGRPLGNFIRKRDTAGTVGTFVADALTGPLAVAANPAGGSYVLEGGGSIDQVSAQGSVTQFVGGFAAPSSMVIDATGTLYVADANGISKVSPAGAITTGLSSHTGPLAFDPKGNLYVADIGADLGQIFQIDPTGAGVAVGQIPQASVVPISLAVDAAGDLYVLDYMPSPEPSAVLTGLWEITPTGHTNWGIAANAIALDSGGHLYYSDTAGIGWLAAGGSPEPILTSPAAAALAGLTFDAAGTLYGVGERVNTLVSIAVPNPDLAAAVLPGSRSVQIGQPADVLASMINAGSTALANCGIALPGDAPAGLSLGYQTTDPTTNALTGTPNTPVAIAAGGMQSFVIALTSATPLLDPGQPLVFSCNGTAASQIEPGVDTVDLLFSADPVVDIIALAATSTGNGIVSTGVGIGGNGAAFAVATTNAGIAAPITVSADTGSGILPITISLCQTDPQTAQCLAPPAASVTLPAFAAGATPTFSIFLSSAIGFIPLDPAHSRVFVRFKDSAGTLHGSTSVAVVAETAY